MPKTAPAQPADDMYVLPPLAAARDRLHYIVVQVSKYRYVVAMFARGGQERSKIPMSYVVVSEPMTWEQADAMAIELTNNRTIKDTTQ